MEVAEGFGAVNIVRIAVSGRGGGSLESPTVDHVHTQHSRGSEAESGTAFDLRKWSLSAPLTLTHEGVRFESR